jgi:uroporphyrinogen decarboxylase
MTSRERITLALDHQEADRIALHDSPWGTTITRWHQEGLPEGVGPFDYFHYEMTGTGPDTTHRFPTETVEETEEYTIVRNSNGALTRNWKSKTSTPEMMDFTITSRALWEEHKSRLEVTKDRIDWENGLKAQAAAREKGYWWFYSGAFGYDKTQGIVGSQRLLLSMLEEPAWVADMFMTSADLVIGCAEEMMGGGFQFDGAFLYDDLGYRNGPLFSPKLYRELLQPAHKKACDFFHGKGLKVILHTCGGVRPIVPDLIESGFDCLEPLEVKSGMNLIELKKEFGEVLSFMGGIDVRAMAHPDPSLIEEETRTKITCAKQGGGYIYHSDHSVPDNVSFERYQRVIALVHQYGSY